MSGVVRAIIMIGKEAQQFLGHVSIQLASAALNRERHILRLN